MAKENEKQVLHNEAFIDGQNLHYSTTHSDNAWKIDNFRFREYLRRKFNVEQAYYFLGCFDDELQPMYDSLQKAGYILVFRKHQTVALSHKKGNVDTDIVFYIMHKLYKRENIDKIYLVSGDGDYYRMVRFLRDENKLGKILLPAHNRSSSLYQRIEQKYRMYLDDADVKKKIAYTGKD